MCTNSARVPSHSNIGAGRVLHDSFIPWGDLTWCSSGLKTQCGRPRYCAMVIRSLAVADWLAGRPAIPIGLVSVARSRLVDDRFDAAVLRPHSVVAFARSP